MYFELRTYRLKVGMVRPYLSLYRECGYDVQREYLGEPVGFFHTELGELNKILHVWRYESLDERAEKRARLFSDPRWTEFLERSWPMVISQNSEIFRQFDLSAAISGSKV